MKIIKFLYRTRFLSYATYPTTLFFCSKSHFLACPSVKLSLCQNQGKLTKIRYGIYLNTRSSMSYSATPAMAREKEMEQMDRILAAKEDDHGGVIVEMTNEPLDPSVFASLLRASLSHWRQQGKKGVWIKLPIELVTLIEPAVKEGFYYHHAEPKYLMLVSWLPGTANTIPANATHRVGIGAFVVNEKNEVLVVQEKSGKFRGTGVWKFPTGVVDEGEDICDAAVREVKEETGVDAKFVEILAFRQSHKSFFDKSDLFFVCMLQPLSFDIQKQDTEIEAAEWMPFEQYAAQPFVQGHDLLRYISDICSAKMQGRYTGFSSVPMVTSFSKKNTHLYMNNNVRTTGHDDL
ncbi:nudix hydrolase 2-like [Lycium barbarum]|uniref:nudix hydrolase 2-like n=1 Tax=Lycium barbarum TaxID=112863 RepID=UPI00293F6DBC|nr:nudix hydrolase 2-like [Lycium barbarum]